MIPGWEILKKADHHLYHGRHALYIDLDEEFEPIGDVGTHAVLPGTLVGNAAVSMYLAFTLAANLR